MGRKVVDIPFDPHELTVDIDLFRRAAPLVQPKLVALGLSMTRFPHARRSTSNCRCDVARTSRNRHPQDRTIVPHARRLAMKHRSTWSRVRIDRIDHRLDLDDLERGVRKRVAGYKVPRSVWLVDRIARTISGTSTR